MRSTLKAGLTPDSRGMSLEYPIVLPPQSDLHTCFAVLYLFAVAMGFNLFLDNMLLFVFFMCISLRLIDYSATLIILLVAHRTFPHIILNIATLSLMALQSLMFARHWVYLQSATMRQQDKQAIRARVDRILTLQVTLLPLSCLLGLPFLLMNIRRAWRAWVSYVNYGREGLRQPGAFHSPAGSYKARRHLFFLTGGATTLALTVIPPSAVGAVEPLLILFLSFIYFIPTTLCFLVPALILAPHLRSKP